MTISMIELKPSLVLSHLTLSFLSAALLSLLSDLFLITFLAPGQPLRSINNNK